MRGTIKRVHEGAEDYIRFLSDEKKAERSYGRRGTSGHPIHTIRPDLRSHRKIFFLLDLDHILLRGYDCFPIDARLYSVVLFHRMPFERIGHAFHATTLNLSLFAWKNFHRFHVTRDLSFFSFSLPGLPFSYRAVQLVIDGRKRFVFSRFNVTRCHTTRFSYVIIIHNDIRLEDDSSVDVSYTCRG